MEKKYIYVQYMYIQREGGRGQCCVTCLSLVDEEGRMGRQNFFMEPMAAGKAGAENSAATRFIRKIQDIISSSLLKRRSRWRRGKRQDYFMTVFIVYGLCIKRLKSQRSASGDSYSRGLQQKHSPVGCFQLQDVGSLAVVGGTSG